MTIKLRLFLTVLPLAALPVAVVSYVSMRNEQQMALGLDAIQAAFQQERSRWESEHDWWMERVAEVDRGGASIRLEEVRPRLEEMGADSVGYREQVALQSERLVAESERSRKLFLFTLWGMLAAMVAGLLLTARRLCRPMNRLIRSAASVSEGNLDTKFTYAAKGDEFDQLSRSIDQMRLRLKSQIEELDTRVAEKTLALGEAYENLKLEIEERSLAERSAQSANAAKSEFLATMSHEIRTPMNGVIGMAEDLLSFALTREQRDRVEMIKLSGESLMRILDDILDLSKIEAGKLEIKEDSFDLGLACRAAHMLFRTMALQKGLQYELSIDDDVPQYVVGDSVRVRQIVSNFLSNAVKFTDAGYVRMHVSNQRRGADGILIEVMDSGPGIPQDQQQTVFEAFAQLDGTSSRDGIGTGLGLTISKRLADLMGGEINLRSEADHGSVFGFWMACSEGVPTQEAEWLGEAEEVEGVRVLLVEDNKINQHVIYSILQRAQHRVMVASDGFEALNLVEKTPFDLVLMDCRMPKLDGFEASKRVRALPRDHFNRNVPIVALTANAFAADREKCFESGMDKFLSKPVNRKTLLQVVNFYGGQTRQAAASVKQPSASID